MKFYLISKYFYSNLNSSDLEIKHFYKEADNFFSLLDQINFIEKYDKSEIIFKFFDTIRKNPLNSYFINSLDIENEIFIYLFDIYIKIIEKCCQIYFTIRQRVFNFKKLKKYKKYFISEDFICFLFEIDHFESKFRNLNEKNKAKIDNLISFFYRIKIIFSNFDKIFFNFRCLSLKTKLLLIPKPDRDQNLLFDSYVFLQIDRNNIIESTIDAFKNFSPEIFSQKNWFVKYSNEEGSGIGLLYEFFNIFGKCIDESVYFAPFKSLEFISICVSSPEEQNKIEQLYYFTGVIMAKSIFMNSVMSFEFINSFYLHLLQEKFNIEDLKDIDFEYYKNLISLRYIENIDPYLTFDISVKIGQKIISENLIENGSEIKVTKDNLEDYIQKMAEFKMFKGMKVYLDKLKEGFQSLFNHCFYNMFTHSDLKIVIEGEKRININEWKAATRYRGKYYTDHQLIVWFWIFLGKSDEITKRKLLFFTTGLSYLPIGGFKSSKFIDHPFTITSDDRKDLFPKSQTCSNLLILPLYDQEDVLLDKIEHAIEVINYGFL
ncbi:E3 ubiquitin-protein ligase tom1 [Hamiltosporidium tvaerminnensis]|nr:E3 ubiquitin-protein ligase tom1 [Hamiltosporidium tvaerminnensis]